MSDSPWKCSTSNGVDQNNMSATSKKESTVPQEAKRRKKTNKWKKISLKRKRGKKRQLGELLESKMECVKHGDVLDSASEPSTHVQFKKPRITLGALTSEAESALPLSDSWEVDSGFSSELSPPTSGRSSPSVGIDRSKLVAIDCEMVGTGPRGKCNEVARCSIVSYNGSVLYDKYILPQNPVTNFRTRWSGIRKQHLQKAEDFKVAQNEIVNILTGKIIVGHALFNDFEVLDISVPTQMIRDTCYCGLLRKLSDASTKASISLKSLSQKLLNRTIQSGRMGHSSVEDACAAMDLYKLIEDQWEKDILLSQDLDTDHTSDPYNNLEHFMQDEYWPESIMDCSP
ncbi:apoptosis-enhancing nuclease [Puntigrus tetrazona]|uniref:apoptosis-enhancing nuclease n=1 Tax=Puntigrus tetrazona TaxID=1606681 RepID=UPI001C8A4011|nr:apoptosis-enhancing nuclease [Puntigrus tetrazona]